ncbi:hypothetical protein CCR75_004615 [Bremia lactucae]|uniref:Nucleotide-diphospho-sugar transferase domain-containing protein n=1 Tax=Bremia lactucae TaxID=4779 RepID=A0A976ILY9_BRELC|nr:hypothetical protein CCR75_004615 [Bremia lactucae]
MYDLLQNNARCVQKVACDGSNITRRQMSRPVMVLLMLSSLGLFLVYTNFVTVWRAPLILMLSKGARAIPQGISRSIETISEPGKNLESRKAGIQFVDTPLSYDAVLMEKQLVYTIHQIAQNTSEKRGIVLPLFNDIAILGVSLIMELRAMNVDLPIEIPHCGDLKESLQHAILKKEDMGVIRFYDVCEVAAHAVSLLDPMRKVFCESLRQCQEMFRSFDIKILAVTYSHFEELMLLDADVLFFENPMTLWETDKYRDTGTLLFHDRLCQRTMFLDRPVRGNNRLSHLNVYIAQFQVAPFALLKNIKRSNASSENMIAVKLNNYTPSEHLLTSHSWNRRSGHEMDSSVVLWSKKRQPRATAILAAFLARNGIRRPPSYGDKEFYFIAAELAETQYAFSDFGVGGAGWEFLDNGPEKSIICGQASHNFPVKPSNASAVANTSLLYLNSEDILKYDVKNRPVYYSQARLYEVYPGSFKDRGLNQKCPFDVTGVMLTSRQNDRILLRQRFYKIAEAWMR